MFKFTQRNGSIKFMLEMAVIMTAIIFFCIFLYMMQGIVKNQNIQLGKEISITDNSPKSWNKYKVYQIFKGKMSSDGKNLYNAEYGANYSGREGVLLEDELVHLEAGGAEVNAFAKRVRSFLAGEPVAILTKENPSVELESGYYITIDESLYDPSDTGESFYMSFVVFSLIGIYMFLLEALRRVNSHTERCGTGGSV